MVASTPYTRTILIVDDQAPMLLLYKRMLAGAGGVQLLTTTDGEEALRIVYKQPLDLIISDISRPHMDGFAFLEEVRSYPNSRYTPFMFVSADFTCDNRLKARHAGANDFLAKPFSQSDLLQRVEALLLYTISPY